MKVTPSDLPEVLRIEPRVHQDERGFFLEIYHERRYHEHGINETFVQDNHSKSRIGTLRGLHAQIENMQGKLIRVIEGEVFDVAADIRVGSPHFGQWVSFNLSATNFHQIYIPPGFAHGFLVLSEEAQVEYKCTEYYDPGSEISIAWNDSDIGVEWPRADPILSPKDERALSLRSFTSRLPVYRDD